MNTIENNLWSESIKKADLVIERNADTFVCYRARVACGKNAEAEPIWKIAMFHTITTDTEKRTLLLYPYGRETYEFAPDKINNYTFDYAK